MTETVLQMAERHVLEGEERLAQHRELMAMIEHDGNSGALCSEEEIHKQLEAFQAQAVCLLSTALQLEEERRYLAGQSRGKTKSRLL